MAVTVLGQLDLPEAASALVEVLEGASASAIYGSKASNGVIIITTKRGRVGTPQFNIIQRFGTSTVTPTTSGILASACSMVFAHPWQEIPGALKVVSIRLPRVVYEAEEATQQDLYQRQVLRLFAHR